MRDRLRTSLRGMRPGSSGDAEAPETRPASTASGDGGSTAGADATTSASASASAASGPSRYPRQSDSDVLLTHEFTEDPYDPHAEDGELAGDDVAAGLDALEDDRKRKRFDWAVVIAPVVAVAALLLLWQSAVWLEIRPPWILPGPVQVWETFTQGIGVSAAASAVWTSLSRGVLGFLLAVGIGTVIGLLIGQVRALRLAFKPVLIALQSLPSVAWVPAAILWFGLSDATMYAVILLGAVPSVAIGLIGGLDTTPPLLSRAGRVMGANRLQLIRHVLLPSALPAYITGVKQGWAFSWRSLMAAEIIVRSPQLGLGLGHLLNQGRDLSDVSLVIVAVILVLIVGIAIDVLFFSPLEKHVLKRRGLANQT